MNVGKTLFAQIMEFVPWTSFSRIVERHSGNAGVRRMNCAEQFRVMAFAQLTWRESLRDIEATLGANANKLYAMGLRHSVHRSTLADANELRDWRIWSDVAALFIRRARKLYADEGLGAGFEQHGLRVGCDHHRSVFEPVRLGAVSLDQGGGQDAHVAGLAWEHPCFHSRQRRKDARCQRVGHPADLCGAFYVMDRGYLDFARLYRMHRAGAFFVTRSKRGMDARRVYSTQTDRSTGVICDQRIALNGFYARNNYPEQLRRIRFKDPETGKTLVFLTNNTTLPALTIAALYKSRWQVELFFKWIKQHLRIKKFLGTSENAVKTQIWCAVSTYVLIAIVKKELQLDASLYTLLQILSVSVFEKTPLNKAFLDAGDTVDQDYHCNQLNLFNY